MHPAASLLPPGVIVNEDELDEIQAAHEARLEDKENENSMQGVVLVGDSRTLRSALDDPVQMMK